MPNCGQKSIKYTINVNKHANLLQHQSKSALNNITHCSPVLLRHFFLWSFYNVSKAHYIHTRINILIHIILWISNNAHGKNLKHTKQFHLIFQFVNKYDYLNVILVGEFKTSARCNCTNTAVSTQINIYTHTYTRVIAHVYEQGHFLICITAFIVITACAFPLCLLQTERGVRIRVCANQQHAINVVENNSSDHFNKHFCSKDWGW